ncbi:MAG: IS4 family transposase [Planctomycetaceae bacterium]|nr:IS4 family transposase [Planctomycetaceae bacterium]
MPKRIVTLLGRLRQDLAACLTPEAIPAAARQAGHSWRKRVLDPVTTISLFLMQVLHGNTACSHVVHFGGWSFTDSASCQARKRLPLAVFQRLLEQTAATLREATATASDWFGHRVWVLDGSGFSMPDVPELQRAFGQPGNQKPGCGFPVARWLARFDVATGMLLRSATAPLRTHDLARAGDVADELKPGDVVLGDCGLCSYAHIAKLAARGLHAVFRMHQRRIVDFTPGRPEAQEKTRGARASGLPHSRWVRAYSDSDQVVIWYKPKSQPKWMTAEEYAELPEELLVRELRYRIETPGFRTCEVTLVTTLLDATVYPAEALADLYSRRWQVELNFRHMKITMKMDVLRCETVDGVLKELAVFSLVSNLIRSAMVESGRLQGVAAERVSLVDTWRWLVGDGDQDESVLRVNPERRGRVEPRVRKRRPNQYPLMKKPRSVLRAALRNPSASKEVVA